MSYNITISTEIELLETSDNHAPEIVGIDILFQNNRRLIQREYIRGVHPDLGRTIGGDTGLETVRTVLIDENDNRKLYWGTPDLDTILR